MENYLRPSTNIQDTNIADSRRTRNAFRASIVLATVFLPVVVLYFVFALQIRSWQLYLLTANSVLLVAGAVISAILSQHHRPQLGISLVIGLIALLFPITSTLQSGLGLVLGIAGLMSISMIASLTLFPRQATIAMFVGSGSAIVTILVDFYAPFPRVELSLIQRYVPFFAVVGIAIYAYFIAKEFVNYSLSTKLIIALIITSVGAVSAVAYATNLGTRSEINKQTGLNINRLAERLSNEIVNSLEAQIGLLKTEGSHFAEQMVQVDSQYTGSAADIVNQIQSLDQSWINSPENSQLSISVLANSSASELRQFQSISPQHVEVFFTDKYGALIAASNRTSDYYQADEEWWQTAYNNGQGAIYIGQPELDESSNIYAVNLAVPVFQGKTVVGVFRSTLNVTSLINLLNEEKFGNTGAVDLRIDEENLLENKKLDPTEIAGFDNLANTYGQIIFLGAPSLVSQVSVLPSDPTSSTKDAFSKLGWHVIVHQDLSEALQPVANQTKTTTLIALATAILAAVLGSFASRRIAAPITHLTNTANRIASGDLTSRAAVESKDEIGALANTFNYMADQLNQTLARLEQRVAERTTDLEIARQQSERHARELQTIGEISSIIASEQKTETLLPLITRLVSERFDFYHVGIFLVDETSQWAVLQAANSEGGQRMLARGHKLEVGATGIVGYVTKNGTARIALDVGADSVFFNNPDLPTTRSEMALPLNARGQIIGALDVQSVRPGAFTEDDANTLGVLADQIAISIENTRLFGRIQSALAEVQSLYRQDIALSWAKFAQDEGVVGYHKTLTEGKLINQAVDTDEIRQTMNRGSVSVFNADRKRTESILVVPVKLRGQVIGVLNIKASKNEHQWSFDEIGLVEAISERLALALENARLLQDSQNRAAKEQAISEITTKISGSINMRNILQTAVEELGHALPGSEVIIEFEQKNGNVE